MPLGKAVLGRAVLELATDGSAMKQGLDKAEKDTEKYGATVGQKAQAIGKKMQGIGVGMSAAVTAPFVLFAKGAVDAASSTEESLSKVRVVFGDTAGVIEAFAKDAAKNLGLSRQAALDAAGTFGNLFSALGLGRPEAAKMSTEILTLAADLASFNNIDPTVALEKLRSGLVGQSEPLRALGVNLTEAAVKAKAMEMGLGGVGRELTEAEKVQARYKLITEQTALAQGDFSRTSTGLANSTRIAKAEQEDMSAEMGQVLLPLMQQMTGLVRGAIAAFMGLSPEVRNGILIFVGLVAVLGPVIGLIGTIIAIAPALGAAFLFLTGPIGLVILAIGLLALAWTTNLGGIQEKTQAVIDAVTGFINGMIQTIRDAIAWIGRLASAIINMPGVQGIASVIGGIRIPGFAEGGVVPGAIGAPQLAVVHGGETIIPAGGMADRTINLIVDGQVLARVVGNRQQQRSFLAGGAIG